MARNSNAADDTSKRARDQDGGSCPEGASKLPRTSAMSRSDARRLQRPGRNVLRKSGTSSTTEKTAERSHQLEDGVSSDDESVRDDRSASSANSDGQPRKEIEPAKPPPDDEGEKYFKILMEKANSREALSSLLKTLEEKNVGLTQKQKEDRAIKFGKEVVYQKQKFINEDTHLTLDGKISVKLKERLLCSHMTDAQWAEEWATLKKKVVQGHQIKRSEHGTKQRQAFFGERCQTCFVALWTDRRDPMCVALPPTSGE